MSDFNALVVLLYLTDLDENGWISWYGDLIYVSVIQHEYEFTDILRLAHRIVLKNIIIAAEYETTGAEELIQTLFASWMKIQCLPIQPVIIYSLKAAIWLSPLISAVCSCKQSVRTK